MEQDEERTVAAIREVLTQVIDPAANRHEGRIVKTMGDGALLEFASPVAAGISGLELPRVNGWSMRGGPKGF
jgi:adenylate cyclase